MFKLIKKTLDALAHQEVNDIEVNNHSICNQLHQDWSKVGTEIYNAITKLTNKNGKR